MKTVLVVVLLVLMLGLFIGTVAVVSESTLVAADPDCLPGTICEPRPLCSPSNPYWPNC